MAVLYLDTGRPEEGREWFERLAAKDFMDIPQSDTWMVTLLLAADAAYGLKDEHRAEQLYGILEPYAQRQVTVGYGFLCDGSGALGLAVLAATMRRWKVAEKRFEEAIAFNKHTGAIPWHARTQFFYADMLHTRDEPGDAEKAQVLVNEALAVFEELGMARFVERSLALKMELQGVDYADLTTSIEAVSVAVQSQQPDLRTHAAPDGTVTLMFTDIVGSTPLNERLGDQRWMDLLKEHNGLVREQISAHEGYEVKTEGDGFMLAFSSARRATECAIAIQRAFAERNETAEEKIEVRAGLHTGEAIQDDGDFYGKHVNLAARIASQATGGQILASSLLKELTDSGGDIDFDGGTDIELKGLTGTQRVFAITW